MRHDAYQSTNLEQNPFRRDPEVERKRKEEIAVLAKLKQKMKKVKTKTKSKILSKTLKLKSNDEPISIIVDNKGVTEMSGDLMSPPAEDYSKSPWSQSMNVKKDLTPENLLSNRTSTSNQLVESIQNNTTNMFASKTMSPQSSQGSLPDEIKPKLKNYQTK